MSDNTTLWCLVEGDNAPFPISISPTAYIGVLKQYIKKDKEITLQKVDASNVNLWKPRVPIPVKPSGTLGQRLRDLKLDLSQFAEELDSADTVAYSFQSQTPPSPTLDVIVQIPASATELPSKKRKLDYDASEFKDVNVAPSKFAKPSYFRKVMGKDEHGREIYVHNRPIDFELVPAALISRIFGRLSDDLFACENDFRSEDFAPARDLVNALSKLEKDEASRKQAFLDWLLATLPDIEAEPPYGRDQPRLSTEILKGKQRDRRSDYVTDGHVELGDNLLLATEGRPELGEESTNPHWQLMSYARAYYMQKRCSYRVGQSCLPAILIAYYGPCIDATAAIICPDGSVQVEALTPALRVDCDFRDDRQRNLLASFVRALRNAFEGLREFYSSPSSPIPDPHGYRSHKHAKSIDRHFPYKNSYTDKEGIHCAFKYNSRLVQGHGTLIFLAEHTEPEADTKPIVVKFTRTYSKVVHDLLAGNGFAPELLAVEDLVGGWKMVVMEHLSGWVMLHQKPRQERLKYKEKLKEALRIIHSRNLVHGDVRCPNILVSKDDNIKFIDFDHCGVDGEDVYPREWDHTLRQVDAREGDVLRKYHDDWMLNRIFDNSAWQARATHSHSPDAPIGVYD